MLRPRIYPELVGRAMMLDPDPFIVMVDDDEPWAEGFFFVVVVGVLVGVARLIGGLLTTATLPPTDALLETLLQGWRQLGFTFISVASPEMEATLRQAWSGFLWYAGLGGGWARLLTLVTSPLGVLLPWLVYGLVGHLAARVLGGIGSLSQTMGATALVAAPHTLLFATALPWVRVPGILLSVWGLLIAYRALQVAHALPWRRAVFAALLPVLVLILLAIALSALAGIAVVLWRW